MKNYKTNLIDTVAARAAITKVEARRILDIVFPAITELSAEDGLTIAGFGTFKYKTRASRTGRNPQTGAPIHIAARKAFTFSESRPAN